MSCGTRTLSNEVILEALRCCRDVYPHEEDYLVSRKIDVILNGMETIGSAERSTDRDQMRDTFYTISDGGYARILYDKLGKERVEKELDEFLDFDFFPRSGGGIGVTRIMQAIPD